ncbi:DUF692 domain-containing protein [Luteithermobacter gelatinilyticus]|uniref:MNIO family bufferin maturase n=1 Tax=Luteithermobacter gelatinilyticus TaxID=2582913 RepID=UPI0011071A61|nr:DUF692 domain-containing protein [Luteithermobacter gelatinilyticus]
MTQKPFLGYGLGLRPDHFEAILNDTPSSDRPSVDWFEIISENFMVPGGKPRHYLERIRERYPLVMHGVSLSIGSTDPLNMEYLEDLKDLARTVNPQWISDHLCWTGQDGLNLHDLMPLPYTEESLNHVVRRIRQVQDYLEQHILIENVSSYLTYNQSDMTEWAFLREIAEQANCYILLDINNIYVSAFNHDFDPEDYLKAMPKERVYQFHLAGHEHNGDYIVDTHDHPVAAEVWALYRRALEHFGPVSTMIERDDHIPPYEDLLAELTQARRIAQEVVGSQKGMRQEATS